MTAMTTRATSPVLIGRDAQLADLGRALAAASGPRGATALIHGEAGVGKTRLVSEFAEEAHRQGWRICTGRCVDLGERIWPLAPLREIVSGLADDLDPATIDRVLGRARLVMARLVPELHDDPAVGAPAVGEDVCELAVGMFRRLADEGPLLLIVEDLHWADDTTRTLFAALARVGRLRSTLLLGTFRSDELHRRHPLRPLLAEVDRDEACHRIEVLPLDQEQTGRLVDAIGAASVDAPLIKAIHRRSAGNPFYVEELAAMTAGGDTDLPVTLRDAILGRTAALDDRSLEVLGVIAAAGRATPEVVADVCTMPTADVRPVIDELCRRALLAPDGEDLRFRHELAREVFDDELLPGERAQIHAGLAISHERHRPDRLGEIARHWAAAHDAPRALAASIAAGRQALSVGAAAEAEGHLERALELWSTVDDPVDCAGLDHPALLAETAVAAGHARHVARAIALDRSAVAELAGVDAMREARVWLHLRGLHRFAQQWDECAAAVQRALALIPASPPTTTLVEALTDATMDLLYAGRFAEALAQAHRAVAIAEVVGEPEALIRAHYALCSATAESGGDGQASLALAEENVARCGPHTSVELTLMALNMLVHALGDLGRFEEIIPVARRGVEVGRSRGSAGPWAAFMANYWLQFLTLLGRWAEAERVAGDLDDLTDDPSEEGILSSSLGMILIRQGRLDEARPMVEDTRAMWERTAWAEDLDWVTMPVALFDAADGRSSEAVDLVERQLQRRGDDFMLRAALVAIGISVLADHVTAARSGRAAGTGLDAQLLADRWLALLDGGFVPSTKVAGVHRDRARAEHSRLSGRPDPQLWRAAVAGCVDLHFPYEEADARFHLAEALLAGAAGREAKSRTEAGHELSTAHSIASALPAPPLVARIEDLARRARVRLDEADAAIDDDGDPAEDLGLTRRELEVLALLAAGRSNGQIGKELYISTKTASVHVSSILRKLGVTNRVEAAAIAARRDRPTV